MITEPQKSKHVENNGAGANRKSTGRQANSDGTCCVSNRKYPTFDITEDEMTTIKYLPVVLNQLTAAPTVGWQRILQAAQLDGHLFQGTSLGSTLTGDQLSLEDTEQGTEARC